MFPHTIITNMAYWWLVLQLHSVSYQRPTEENLLPTNDSRPFGEMSEALCDRAAQEIMLLVDLYKRWHGLQFFPRNMVQVIFVAGVLFLKRLAANGPEGAAVHHPDPQGAVLECVAALRAMAETWECAEGYANRLQALLQNQNHYRIPRAQGVLRLRLP
ncbi:hypothetical protein FRC08_006241 [Ceratobasidium sp. 394]|nr:hypothetical protein FRC08_006241 [Ceratobasidium sp. 394]KAG9094335.1 hypothetical protein FS749_012674 [Ceratobasidium sp. UAMH 11750]